MQSWCSDTINYDVHNTSLTNLLMTSSSYTIDMSSHCNWVHVGMGVVSVFISPNESHRISQGRARGIETKHKMAISCNWS